MPALTFLMTGIFFLDDMLPAKGDLNLRALKRRAHEGFIHDSIQNRSNVLDLREMNDGGLWFTKERSKNRKNYLDRSVLCWIRGNSDVPLMSGPLIGPLISEQG